MKISPNVQILNPVNLNKTHKNQLSPNNDFGDFLRETMAKPEKCGSEIKQMPSIGNLSEVQWVRDSFSYSTPTIESVEKFIDLLDEYQQKLANPQVPMNELNTLIQMMEREKIDLSSAMASLPDGDGLKSILNETLITVSLEVAKFRRGDYWNS